MNNLSSESEQIRSSSQNATTEVCVSRELQRHLRPSRASRALANVLALSSLIRIDECINCRRPQVQAVLRQSKLYKELREVDRIEKVSKYVNILEPLKREAPDYEYCIFGSSVARAMPKCVCGGRVTRACLMYCTLYK